MKYSEVNDEEIIKDMAIRLDVLRRSKEIKDAEIAKRGGITMVTISKFRSGQNITLKTFIRLLRALGELDRLEALLPKETEWSPLGVKNSTPKHRVRSKRNKTGNFIWGDEK